MFKKRRFSRHLNKTTTSHETVHEIVHLTKDCYVEKEMIKNGT
jgi:hypothetical protein